MSSQLAMLKVNPATALLMLARITSSCKPGDWLIQDAANSGVGVSLIELAKMDGVRTVNVVRRPELVDVLKDRGADVVVVDGDDLVERVAGRGTGHDHPIKLAIDAVGGSSDHAPCRLSCRRAVWSSITAFCPVSLARSAQIKRSSRASRLTGFWLQKALTSMARSDAQKLYQDLSARVRSGDLHVEIEATYPIEQIKEAVDHAGRSGRGGKILVLPNGPVRT